MKVLLSTLNSKFIHTNLAIRYIKAYSKDLIESGELDLKMKEYTINNSIDYILKDIIRMDYDIVVFSVYIWNVEDIALLCENLKKVRKSIKIIWGGPEVSYDYVEAMKKYPFLDCILFGEGEKSFRELMISLNENPDRMIDVKGVCFRYNGKIYENEPMPLIENLDSIPSPYENLDRREYENKIVYFESSRGCPFNCQYCLSSAIKGLRYFSTQRIKKDLKRLIDARVSQIKFIDRTFNANREIAKDVMNFLMENDNGYTTYHFEVTAHLIDDDMLEFLKDAKPGLFQFEIGVQSTNEQTIRAVGRTDDFKRLSKVVKTVKSYRNIHQHLDLIAGLPYEGYSRFSKSFDDVYNLKSECLQLGFLKMIKGTGIRDRSDMHGYIYKDYPPYEILYNNYITFREILKLKDIEEILEIYYNSGNYSLSIDYAVYRFFERPFDFYEKFAGYYDEKGYFDIGNSKNRQYEIFMEFMKEIVFPFTENEQEEISKFSDILKFDYISLGKPSSIPPFFSRIEVSDYKNKGHQFLKNEQNQEKYIPEYLGEAAKNIIKYVHFEEFAYNVNDLKKNIDADIFKSRNTVMFFYDVDKIFEKSRTAVVNLD